MSSVVFMKSFCAQGQTALATVEHQVIHVLEVSVAFVSEMMQCFTGSLCPL